MATDFSITRGPNTSISREEFNALTTQMLDEFSKLGFHVNGLTLQVNRLDSCLDKHFNELQSDMKGLQRQVDSLNKRVDGLQTEMKVLQKHVNSLDKEVDGL